MDKRTGGKKGRTDGHTNGKLFSKVGFNFQMESEVRMGGSPPGMEFLATHERKVHRMAKLKTAITEILCRLSPSPAGASVHL